MQPRSRLLSQRDTAEDRVKRWGALYDSTPDGQTDLEAAIASTNDEREQKRLERRLTAARRLRANELKQARENHARMKTTEKDDTTHEHTEHTRPDSNGPHRRDAVDRGPRDVPASAGTPGGSARGAATADPGPVAGLGHPGGDRGGTLLVGDGTAHIVQTPAPSARVDALRARGQAAPAIYQIDAQDAPRFREAISALREGNPYAAAVHVYDTAEYSDMRMYVTNDGKAGFAISDDDVVSVFVSRHSEHRGAAGSLIANAVEQGGRRLDCFDTVLPKIYASEGFVPVARIPWNDEYAPEGWDYQTFQKYNGGRPDVVLMAYNEDHLDSTYQPGTGQTVDDYDDGVALVDQYLTQQPSPTPIGRDDGRADWSEVCEWEDQQRTPGEDSAP